MQQYQNSKKLNLNKTVMSQKNKSETKKVCALTRHVCGKEKKKGTEHPNSYPERFTTS